MSGDQPRFVDAGPLRIAGLDRAYKFAEIGGIPGQWADFGPFIGRMPGQVGKVSYGLCHHMSDTGITYLAGVEVADDALLLDGIHAERLSAQRYAVFPHREHVSKLSETMRYIWSAWLPSSGSAVVDSPVIFERYGESFDPAVGSGDIEVWLAIAGRAF